ncbi:MAG: hypothetical protein ACI8VT_003942, partial [Saprospiraceae bacterium]
VGATDIYELFFNLSSLQGYNPIYPFIVLTGLW